MYTGDMKPISDFSVNADTQLYPTKDHLTVGRRKRRETAPVQAPPELEECKLCLRLGPRHNWTRSGHSGFCSEGHKREW